MGARGFSGLEINGKVECRLRHLLDVLPDPAGADIAYYRMTNAKLACQPAICVPDTEEYFSDLVVIKLGVTVPVATGHPLRMQGVVSFTAAPLLDG